MGAIKQAIEQELPGVFVHSIATGFNAGLDVLSGYFGSVNEQVRHLLRRFRAGGQEGDSQGPGTLHCSAADPRCSYAAASHAASCSILTTLSTCAQVAAVCDELLGMEELRDGFVAVGFSQVRQGV